MEAGREINSVAFWEFAKLAQKEELQYLVIGGLALNFHKILRNTIDSDLWIKPEKTNFFKLQAVLLQMNYDKEELQFLEGLPEKDPFVFGIEGPIEFLTHVHFRFDFEECAKRALFFEVENTQIPIISLLDLRELKVLSGRPQDLRDVILIDEFVEKSGKNQGKKG